MHWSIYRPRRQRAQPQSSGPNTRSNHTVGFLCKHGEGRYRCAGHIPAHRETGRQREEIATLGLFSGNNDLYNALFLKMDDINRTDEEMKERGYLSNNLIENIYKRKDIYSL